MTFPIKDETLNSLDKYAGMSLNRRKSIFKPESLGLDSR